MYAANTADAARNSAHRHVPYRDVMKLTSRSGVAVARPLTTASAPKRVASGRHQLSSARRHGIETGSAAPYRAHQTVVSNRTKKYVHNSKNFGPILEDSASADWLSLRSPRLLVSAIRRSAALPKSRIMAHINFRLTCWRLP